MSVLAPEHRKDLQQSGLTDDIAELLGIVSLSPRDIPIKAAQSAYKIPYYRLDGKPNCFYRLKLVPAVKGSDGHSLKYYQEPSSKPGMYCPPLLNWQSVATNAKTVLTITEGEKKAACACARGLVTAGIGGVWCWASTLDNGEKLVLPMLDEFTWTNRPVLLCPDSDAWHEGKEHSILAGFFALAKELQQRGAAVHFVVLPDVNGVKAGLDDWLLVPGNDAVEHSWPKLERLPLDHAKFAHLTAWWQKWKERQLTHTAIREHDLDALDVTEVAGLYTVRSPKHGVKMIFDRLTDARGGVNAELTITVGATELRGNVQIGLTSDMGQSKMAQSLQSLAAAIPWKMLVHRACAAVLKRHRQGEPPVLLNKHTVVEPLTFAINPLVPRHKASILFSDGGKGKSTLALMLAMLASTGKSVAGFSALPGRAMYLDWEDDQDVHARRLHAIRAGHPELDDAEVHYQRCVEPLVKITHELARSIQRDGITFVVIDSLLVAMGGEASAEAVGKFFGALRVLKVESLCIGHVPKTLGEGQEHATVYGSVFNQNLARSLWELRTEQEVGEDSAILGLIHRKSNLTRKHQPIGLKVTHNVDGTYVRYDAFDLSQAAELAESLPVASRIRNLLEDEAPRTPKDIAEETGIPLPTVQRTLTKHKGLKWHMLGGPGQTTQWTVLGSKRK